MGGEHPLRGIDFVDCVSHCVCCLCACRTWSIPMWNLNYVQHNTEDIKKRSEGQTSACTTLLSMVFGTKIRDSYQLTSSQPAPRNEIRETKAYTK